VARYRGTWPFDGHEFRSKFELGIAKQLKEAGIKYDYEKESFEYFTKVRGGICEDCDGTHTIQRHWYTPDFFLPNGLLIEAKGHFTASNRATLKAVRDSHDSIDLRLLFQSDNKISRNSGTRCSEWCEQHGFDYAIRTIPEEWYK
jgi:hypothetical protein